MSADYNFNMVKYYEIKVYIHRAELLSNGYDAQPNILLHWPELEDLMEI